MKGAFKAVKVELQEKEEEIEDMNQLILKTWERLGDEKLKKESAIRKYRIERSASQELVKHYAETEDELAAYQCPRNGWIERAKYNDLQQECKEAKDQLKSSQAHVEAWKSHCNRVTEQASNSNQQVKLMDLTVQKLGEQISLMKS